MLVQIDQYLRRTGMSQTKFGREVAKDPRLVGDMRNGREIRGPLRDKILAYIGGQPVEMKVTERRRRDVAPRIIAQPRKEPEVLRRESGAPLPPVADVTPKEEPGGYGLTIKAEGYMAHVYGFSRDMNPYPLCQRSVRNQDHRDWNAGWDEFVPGKFADDPEEDDL